MSFKNKSTVIYKVWTLDVWGNAEDGYEVNDRREAGALSVRTDENRNGNWSVSNKSLTRALVSNGYLKPGTRSRDLDIDGEDDGVLFVADAEDNMPIFQLEYERHHHLEPKGLLGEPAVRKHKKNPINLSNAEMIGLGVLGVAVVGGIGYWLYKSSQASQAQAQAATLPVVQTSPEPRMFPPAGYNTAPVQPTPGVTDVPPSIGGQVYDPNLGGSGAIMPMGG